jgi:hypothetical protein
MAAVDGMRHEKWEIGALSRGPLAPRSHLLSSLTTPISRKTCKPGTSWNGAYRDRTGDLRLANPSDYPTPPDTDEQNRHD